MIVYANELTAVGYGEKWRQNVCLSALKGYEKVLEQVKEGKAKRITRRSNRLTGSYDWFSDKERNDGSSFL